ncbi:LacI family DNA-binding transcriptional regulator [Devosia sp. ZW T5_3]|uniref:LacI family DNA-binding transcriptional regulator n=1 Tax=Devosia sp. ZW T5_3 TaxID=3378085 RepID=UPI0038536BAD
MKRRVKMIDVARRAGVSQTTVSLVLNNIAGIRIAEATRAHVIETARVLGYSPGPMLHELQTEHVPIIGVLINEISSAYPIDIIDGLHVTARAAAMQLAVFVTDGVVEREAEALKSLRRLGVESVIYANTFTAAVHPTEDLRDFRHVYVNCVRNDGSGTAVIPGERAAGFAAAQYLIGTGCKRLATITGDDWHSSAQRRLSGFRRGAKAGGLSIEPAYVRHGDWGHRRGREAMIELLALPQPPDAVFCQNDMLARGALAAIAEAGLAVPGDISVLGLDEREFARDLGLSTMLLPHAEMAERAINILTGPRRLDLPATISIRCRLIPRLTTR